jgi:hypothetical protein
LGEGVVTRIRADALAELSWEQLLELIIGPHASGSEFDSDEQRRAAWLIHRDRILADSMNGEAWGQEHYDAKQP